MVNPSRSGSVSRLWGTIMRKLGQLPSNKTGASATEYALILAVLGTAVIAGLTNLGGGITNAFAKTANSLNYGS